MVGNKAMKTTRKDPRNFPTTSCHVLNGFVRKISKVPVRNSSEKLRIVIAGIRNNNIQGANSKNWSRVAYPKSRMLESGKTKRKRPLSKRKTMMAMYPVRLLKNCLNSFLHTDHMCTKIRDSVYKLRKGKACEKYEISFVYIRFRRPSPKSQMI